ncbi:hypothetical protein AVEN_248628-1, partial [Araneus ventricosus]
GFLAEWLQARKPNPLNVSRVCGSEQVKSDAMSQTTSRWCGADVWRRVASSGVVLVI